MADKHILHMVTPLKHISPFDVNMAVDAGFDAVTPYTNTTLEEVTGLVQDAIFSRPPMNIPVALAPFGPREKIASCTRPVTCSSLTAM